jgi:hypothetical protein
MNRPSLNKYSVLRQPFFFVVLLLFWMLLVFLSDDDEDDGLGLDRLLIDDGRPSGSDVGESVTDIPNKQSVAITATLGGVVGGFSIITLCRVDGDPPPP